MAMNCLFILSILPAELAAGQVVKEALRTRGLKDDTTCIVVDIIPLDNSEQPSAPPKKQSKLRALFSRTRCRSSANKLSKKHSAIGIVEELFEEGSAMLAERNQNLEIGLPPSQRMGRTPPFPLTLFYCGRPLP